MKKEVKRIKLNRETLRSLTDNVLPEAGGGFVFIPSRLRPTGCPATLTCGISCSDVPCA